MATPNENGVTLPGGVELLAAEILWPTHPVLAAVDAATAAAPAPGEPAAPAFQSAMIDLRNTLPSRADLDGWTEATGQPEPRNLADLERLGGLAGLTPRDIGELTPAEAVRYIRGALERQRGGLAAHGAPAHGGGGGQDAGDLRHGPDFRSVVWGDEQYSFTGYQAAAVKLLWKARDNGTPDVGEQCILEGVDSCGSRLRDIFSKNPAWGTLIVPGRTKGTFRLAE